MYSISMRLMIVSVLTVALTAVGFAHKTAQTQNSPDLEAYLQIAGSLEGICGTLDDTFGNGPDCEACRLVDTMMTPVIAPGPSRHLPVAISQMRHLALLRHHAKPLDSNQRSRAPPHA
ncbi:hypothetical protein G5B38_12700 [Pseudohalocynthiibacter aestuariivivens]|uniref:Polyketide synthase n=1 Tax=Roseovarius pelagicus TaxID=2980108 RepID=A0ABY6D951_9RHOB|nr:MULTISPECIES: hypothetical protein [Rhodobacterales]QIE46314.1 hypothetical protein G5B38_12700 [Pseudohalocynthiibacter aestuariivivens]UXX81708.1 hypothetical protein N7U68_11250 [Roseovarius pelagicus]